MNWKTTVSSLITAVAGFVLFSPEFFSPLAISVSKYIMAGGLVGMGLAAKDHNVTGGTKLQ